MFGKKKKMIDVRELQRRGMVRLPKKDIVVPTNRDGFVEFGGNARLTANSQQPTTNQELFGFPNTANDQQPTTNDQGGYNKREVDAKITALDNKIYKLENRIELLEKKLGINQPSTPALGVMGW
ncbi:MAG: hypothetical protein KJ592_02590 [Nanoarchaeota archaeon]|nr:hypothetical protein [Nanoarchaeota archaeon]